MKKKLFICIFAVAAAVITLCALSLSSSAENRMYDGCFSYIVKDGKAQLAGVVGEYPANLTVPSKANGYPVTSVKKSAFANKTRIASVVFSEGIVEIGDYAFSGCTSLTEVRLPKSAVKIGRGVFRGCESLKSVDLPPVSEIYTATFERCASLKSVSIPKTVKKVSWDAFKGCNSLTDVKVDQANGYFKNVGGAICNKSGTTLYFVPMMRVNGSFSVPGGVNAIGVNAFYNNTRLRSITFPSTLKEIGESAFENCTALVSVSMPSTVEAISARAFCGCTSLKEIAIPKNVSVICESAFERCRSLGRLTFGGGETTIGKNAFLNSGLSGQLNIPNSVREIYSGAFSKCTGLTGVSFGTGLEVLASGCFYESNNITSIKFSSRAGSLKLPDYMFRGLRKLAKLDLGSVSSIGVFAFDGCKALTDLVIPDSVEMIDNYGFANCTGLKTVSFGKGVRAIMEDAFENCPNITSVKFVKGCSAKTLAVSLFEGKKKLVSVDLGTLSAVSMSMFENCTALTSVVIPAQTETVGYEAFKGCTSLKSVKFGAGLKKVDFGAFWGCTSLKTAAFNGNSSVEVGERAFCDCSALSNLKLNGVRSIDNLAFCGCSSLKNVVIPDSTEVINAAFHSCTSLQTFTIGKGVSTIHVDTFFDCPSIETFTVTDSNEHFSSVDGVLFSKDGKTLIFYPAGNKRTEYTLVHGIKTLEEHAFRGAVNLKNITMDVSVKQVKGLNVFNNCKFTTVYYGGTEEQWNAGPASSHYPANCKIKFNSPVGKFNDVAGGGWYLDGINYCLDKGYMSGTSETQFGTFSPFTRAMFVTVLAKIDGVDLSRYDKTLDGLPFTDVKENAYYIRALKWAYEKGYTTGTGKTTFGTNSAVTREQLATFLYNYTKKKGYDVSASDDLAAFTDAGKISKWALTGVKWAVASGLISGTSDTALSPKSTATRAQIATIIMKYDGMEKQTLVSAPPAEVGAAVREFYNSMDVRSYQYYGEYNGAYAVRVNAAGYAVIVDRVVAGYKFRYGSSIEIEVYKDGGKYSLEEAYGRGILTAEDVGVIWTVHNSDTSIRADI